MKEFLTNKGWTHFKTGCSCQGSPRHYKHNDYFDYTIILRSNRFSIKKGYDIIASGTLDKLEQKMKQYELIKENTTKDQDMEA